MDTVINRSELLIGKENSDKLANATVAVIGLGGVGGFACEAIARSFVKEMILIDFDTVEQSNLNRQLIATQDTIGQYKVDCFKKRILSINPNCTVHAIADKFAMHYLEDKHVDFIIDAVDDVNAKVEIYQYALQHQIDSVMVCGTARKKDPTQLKVMTLNQTSYDPLAKAIRTKLRKCGLPLNGKVICSTEQSVDMTDGMPLPSMVFVPSTAGILAANVCIQSILSATLCER